MPDLQALIFKILSDDASKTAPAPEWFKVFPAGEVLVKSEDKPFYMDAEGAAMILEYFESLGHDMAIDYEHQTLTGEKAPAAGWITKLEWRDNDGLWARATWTDEAAEYISKREYRYFSPVFYWEEQSRRIVGLYNVALTNQPGMQHLTALAAKHNLNNSREEEPMLEKLKKLLGLAESAGEDDTLAKVKEVVAKNLDLEEAVAAKDEIVAAKEILEALDLEAGASAKDAVNAVEGLKAASTAAEDLSRQVSKLTTSVAEIKRDDLVELALKDGKISPDEVDKWGRDLAEKNPAQFEKIVLTRAKGSVIPVEDLPAGKPRDGVIPDETQIQVNKMMGVDPELFKKYNPETGQDA